MQICREESRMVWKHYWCIWLPIWLENVEAMKIMNFPSTAEPLCKFIDCCGWISNGIPDFQHIPLPLSDTLETAYTMCGKQRKQALKKVALVKLPPGAVKEAAFTRLKEALTCAVKLALLEDNYITLIFANTRHQFLASIATSVQPPQIKLDVGKQ